MAVLCYQYSPTARFRRKYALRESLDQLLKAVLADLPVRIVTFWVLDLRVTLLLGRRTGKVQPDPLGPGVRDLGLEHRDDDQGNEEDSRHDDTVQLDVGFSGENESGLSADDEMRGEGRHTRREQ